MANITRFDPLGEMVSLRHAMDRLFEDSVVSPLSWQSGNGSDTLTPPIDVYETPDDLVVTVALPGMRSDDVEITMVGQTLSLRGEFKPSDEIKPEQYLYRERRYGTFSRTLQLPVRVEGEKAEATFHDGLLSLRVPKADEVKPRQIRISANASGNDKS